MDRGGNYFVHIDELKLDKSADRLLLDEHKQDKVPGVFQRLTTLVVLPPFPDCSHFGAATTLAHSNAY